MKAYEKIGDLKVLSTNSPRDGIVIGMEIGEAGVSEAIKLSKRQLKELGLPVRPVGIVLTKESYTNAVNQLTKEEYHG